MPQQYGDRLGIVCIITLGGRPLIGGIDTAKVNITLRIYGNAWHVYAGLAILNPVARVQIDQYAKSTTELFKLMLSGGTGAEEDRRRFRERVEWGRDVVFGDSDSKKKPRTPILLPQEVLDRFSLGQGPHSLSLPVRSKNAASPTTKYRPNSHLSLLAMVDCWAHLRIQPYDHLGVFFVYLPSILR